MKKVRKTLKRYSTPYNEILLQLHYYNKIWCAIPFKLHAKLADLSFSAHKEIFAAMQIKQNTKRPCLCLSRLVRV